MADKTVGELFFEMSQPRSVSMTLQIITVLYYCFVDFLQQKTLSL